MVSILGGSCFFGAVSGVSVVGMANFRRSFVFLTGLTERRLGVRPEPDALEPETIDPELWE